MPAPEGNDNALGNEGGRPTKYVAAYADQARKLCQLGATDIEIADFFGVSTSTFYLWRNLHVEFSEAVSIGKDRADERVERSLYNRAVGYTFESEKVFQHQGQIVRAEIREHVPPDTGAAFNWLKNRKPEVWRDKQEVAHSGEVTIGGVSGLLAAVRNAKADNG